MQAEGSDWTNVIIPGDDNTDYQVQVSILVVLCSITGKYSQTMRWRLDNLFPDTTYECLVQVLLGNYSIHD